ncbi:fluoride efflux transporter CrcB [Compostibacter hankyongensis]|uniref:Fluoride-specific ion channel FluC n=1 Tax=Compostibacter hankyongensis TaxID=1007089 RepID=A0ABP8FRT6_9BACT
MIKTFLLIGTGGFLGSIGRYLVQQLVFRRFPSSFPFGTLLVNITACFLIGLVYGLSEKGNLLSPEWRLFLATGICGGYSTFSSFAYENVALLGDGEILYTFLYTAVSILIGFLAVYGGIVLVKSY